MIRSLYLENRFFFILIGITVLYIAAFIFPILYLLAQITSVAFLLLFILDFLLLYLTRIGIIAKRELGDKLSNGDPNLVTVTVKSHYPFSVQLLIIDEIPFQFQKRDFNHRAKKISLTPYTFQYTLKPVQRGVYTFGVLNVFASSPIGLVSRRYRFEKDKSVAVYPSFLQMRQYELLAISQQLTEIGIKKIRRLGNNKEFEQIKEYVQGDDIRTINWKATARTNSLRVNKYQDERAQQVYNIIDKSRLMKMPFDNMTLLDYAINASLVMANTALNKHDKAGLITFNHKIDTSIPADRKSNQLQKILEALYQQESTFKEADFEKLYIHIKRQIKQRSLILLYTNFEALTSLERQLHYFKGIASHHLLVLVFFENTAINTLLNQKTKKIREIYIKTIAEKSAYEKKQIVKTLNQFGIQTILTTPKDLTVNTINKYIALKARGLI